MIGLDTNVLLRLFVEDDPEQSDRARRFVDAAAADEPCIVNPVVLAEFAWTLARTFKKKRHEVARLIEGVLSMDDLEVPFRRAARGALTAYRHGKADFPDYFLAAINAELGCASTATFDRDALDYPAFSPCREPSHVLQRPASDLASPRALCRDVRPDDRRQNPPR
jgi:predicted nucleic-acid-binding protein